MAKVIEKNSIKVGKEPVVILPLKEWKKIEETFEEWEDFVRYVKAISDPENQRLISFEEVKKKLNLP
jgi:hypothetical protein